MGKHKKKKNKKNRKSKQEKLKEKKQNADKMCNTDKIDTSKIKKEYSTCRYNSSMSPAGSNRGRSGSKSDHHMSRSRDSRSRSRDSRSRSRDSRSRSRDSRSRSRDSRSRSRKNCGRSLKSIGKNQDELKTGKSENRSDSEEIRNQASSSYRCERSNKNDESKTAESNKVLIPKLVRSSSNQTEKPEKITCQGLERKRVANQESFNSPQSRKKSRWSESNCNIQDQIKVTDKNMELFFGWESPFSQHHPCNFKVNGKIYNCAEQYYMSQKAATFNDKNIEMKVMLSSDPKEQKRFGKRIKGFKDAIWKNRASQVVFEANLAKFEQNPKLFKNLLDTGDSILAEASPYDRYWGIGLPATDPRAKLVKSWCGQNMLGKILMEVRTKLKDSL